VKFKILILTYKTLHDMAPDYLKNLITPYKPSRTLRSSSKNLLKKSPFNLKTYGSRAFCISASELWNNLPEDIMDSSAIDCFKRKLKTHLFKLAFEL
jgi:hypothetical protein